MSTLTDKICTALGTAPIRSLTDAALRREFLALNKLRKALVPAAPKPAVKEPVPAHLVAGPFKLVPVSKGSIFSKRVPLNAPEKTQGAAVSVTAKPSRVQSERAERAAALASGVPETLYQAFVLRRSLLEAEVAARARRIAGPGREPGAVRRAHR